MPFKKGDPKPPGSGRKKGQKSKDKQALEAKLDALKCGDPIEALARVGMQAEADGDLSVAANCYKELAQYRWPKLKAIEVSGPGGGVVEVIHVAAGVTDIGPSFDSEPEPAAPKYTHAEMLALCDDD